jgi:competence ComEA-like helix-hairpin-helix protein
MKNSLDFSKKSRRAVILFIILFLGIILLPRIYFLWYPDSSYTFTQTDFEKKSFAEANFKERKKNFSSYQKKESKFKTPDRKFDPNTYGVSDWMLLGLSEKQAAILLKFGKRGFYSHEDLKQVFVVSDAFFAKIKDSLVYPSKPTFTPKQQETKKVFIVELNTASEEELMNLKGIGAFFAKNIVKKRNELGGFITTEQVLEVWKMDQEKYELIKPQIKVDPSLVKTININEATAEELKKHPYVTWNVANSIVKMRMQNGPYNDVSGIKRSAVISQELYEKLKPYLTVE